MILALVGIVALALGVAQGTARRVTDRSVPVGDRNEPPAVTGAALARQALARAEPTFLDGLFDRARLYGWKVAWEAKPRYGLLRRGELLVVHVGPVTGFSVDELLHDLRQVRTVRTAHLRPGDGLGPVDAALRAEAS